MKIREKNPLLMKEIAGLNKAGVEKPIWKAVAKGMNRPRSQRFEVDLSRLERFAEENETILVPGIVLGQGQLKKRLRVAAVRFSTEARKKIEKAGGKCLAIEEVSMEEPSKIRIMG